MDESSSSEAHCQTETICQRLLALACLQIPGLSHVFPSDKVVSAICHGLVYLPNQDVTLLPGVSLQGMEADLQEDYQITPSIKAIEDACLCHWELLGLIASGWKSALQGPA